MVELEIQTLSLSREGLLIDVGRSVTESGFTLQRQRLTQDPNGVLLTMVVRGAPRRQRVLEAALENHERVISFDVFDHVEGETRPHFAATLKAPPRTPPPATAAETPPARSTGPAIAAAGEHSPRVIPAPAPIPTTPSPLPTPQQEASHPPQPPATATVSPLAPVADLQKELAMELERMLPPALAPARKIVPPPAPEPFVDIATLAPDTAAVDRVLEALPARHPSIIPDLLELDRSVAAGAREPSLDLAGQRIGAWLAERGHAQQNGMGLLEALDQIALPALGATVDVERVGEQVHIRHSALCAEEGRSGCSFYSGFLRGVLTPVMGSDSLSIFPVCCRSFGADDCVLALSD